MRARNTARSLPAPFTDAQLAVIARMVDAAVMGERERLNEEFDRFLEERLAPMLVRISKLQDVNTIFTTKGAADIRSAGSVAQYVIERFDTPWTVAGRKRMAAAKRDRDEAEQRAIDDQIEMNLRNGGRYSGPDAAVPPEMKR